ncbi:hypothetical protein ISF_01859 [Cordyceps fumosorosea ARSEF 2679]|uniref:Uncharacterized protein n=1 Tax=Cordyceps fumosorosea (strain ARSEF 2679) TaxID=1081104 RepID=A0A168CFD7_CORFA|nr:hypothetical protein ISF_01859 [Cordyceps fumosorosea ARSEF 2679]OAA71308.1 hypothetical protein ISF_01859 [Cordyceps fumosorosea ARSEF 2679]
MSLNMQASILLQVLMLAFAATVSAGTTELPELVPGPGLPSLESLGLTSEQLYNMPSPLPSDSKLTLSPAFDGVCGPAERAYTDVHSLIACFQYLDRLGTQPCVAPPGRKNILFCRSGSSHVNGVAITGKSESSYW